jgi:lambda repressor-like predicted transcriptional regulator
MPDDNLADEAFKRLMAQAAEAIAKSEEYLALLDNPVILKYLKQHPDEFTRIAALPQASAVEELKKLALACRPKIISSAPRPPTPLTPPSFVITAPRFESPWVEFVYEDRFPETDKANMKLAILGAVGMDPIEGIKHVLRAYVAVARALGTQGIWSFNECELEIRRILRFLASSQGLVQGIYSVPRAEVRAALESILQECASPPAGVPTTGTEPDAPIEPLRDAAARREAVIRPILRQKGWTVSAWAVQAGVDPHTAINYLKGIRRPHSGTRKLLADALGLKVKDLPL